MRKREIRTIGLKQSQQQSISNYNTKTDNKGQIKKCSELSREEKKREKDENQRY